MAYLVVHRNGEEIARKELTKILVAGRGELAGMRFDSGALSRQHCRFEPAGKEWAVVDLHSRNGTHVNGQRVTRHVLHNGDLIAIGDVRIGYYSGAFVAAAEQKVGQEKAPDSNSLHDSTRILPTPRPRNSGEVDQPLAPRPVLPYARPPARPIIKPPISGAPGNRI